MAIDPRFGELQRRHDARGLSIRARAAGVRALSVLLFPLMLVVNVGHAVWTGARDACRDAVGLWTDAYRIILERDARKLRKVIYGKQST